MKQKQQVGALLILVLIAAVVWLWNFRDKRVVTADVQSIQEDPIVTIENPRPRIEQIQRARKAEYKGSGRNPFSYTAAPYPSQLKPGPDKPDLPGPKDQPPPPPPPPLTLPPNLKFYGFGTVPNSASRRAFFTDGETIYFVAEGELLLNRFRILRIGNASLEFEEISSGRTGTAPLEEQAAGPGQ
ncbi:MAG TPA: hypothetical protein VNB49_15785 [Candidatus Dormibacteraeota bacterium]|nr:hypothetical protein [Candidatus Dormibacteraeota bacterium]